MRQSKKKLQSRKRAEEKQPSWERAGKTRKKAHGKRNQVKKLRERCRSRKIAAEHNGKRDEAAADHAEKGGKPTKNGKERRKKEHGSGHADIGTV